MSNIQNEKLSSVYRELCLLTVLKEAGEDRLPMLFEEYLRCFSSGEEKLKKYAAFVSEIYNKGGNLSDCVRKLLFENENIYIKTVGKGKSVPLYIEEALKHDLSALSAFASLSVKDFLPDFEKGVVLPAFASEETDLLSEYTDRIAQVGRYGYGIFAFHGMFRLNEEGKIEPVKSSDKIDLAHFVGYRDERQKVMDAAGKFVEGVTNTNVLLTGDAGTGKSSTVKAVANHYYKDGLRLIEVRKDQLKKLPAVMDQVCDCPLKFIIFIDDLSFSGETDDLGMLKAILEGSASAKAENTVIYATSNRHHIVKESFSDRVGDDIHQNDTMQETISLSERFGLSVYYGKPDKKLYLEIVHSLASRKGIELSEALDIKAEAFALRKGNRSARCAEQFVNSLL